MPETKSTFEPSAYSRMSPRRQREWDLSSGYYTQSDIARLFEIQNQRCYFTSEPFDVHKDGHVVDHLKPVRDGGSSWPGNLALVLPSVNGDKRTLGKIAYWNVLAKRHGDEWVKSRRSMARQIDKERKKLHAERVRDFKAELTVIRRAIKHHLPREFCSLDLNEDDMLELSINEHSVVFAPGTIRRRKLFQSEEYFLRVAVSLMI